MPCWTVGPPATSGDDYVILPIRLHQEVRYALGTMDREGAHGMLRHASIVTAVALLTSGCVTQHSLQLDPPDRAAVSTVATEIGGGSARGVLEGETVAEATRLRWERDTLWWETPDGERHAADPARIRAIEVRDRGRGVLEGVLGGVAVAVVAAGAVALCCEAQPGAWIDPKYVAGVGTALVSIPVGALIGAIRGHLVILGPD